MPIKPNDKLRFYKAVFLYQISGLLQPFPPQKFRDIIIMLNVRILTIIESARLSTGHCFVQSFIKIYQQVWKLLRVDRCTDMIYHCLCYEIEGSRIKLLNLRNMCSICVLQRNYCAEVKNEWGYNPTPSSSLHSVHKDAFTPTQKLWNLEIKVL